VLHNPKLPLQQGDHNGNAFCCAYCGRPLRPKRGSRRQRFCSKAHRQASFRVRKWSAQSGISDPDSRLVVTPGYPGARALRSVENPPVVSGPCKADLADLAYSIISPPEVIEAEIVAPHTWVPVISPDGVRCEVARVRLPDSVPTGMPSRWEPTWSPAWRDQPDLPVPDFLRREIPADSSKGRAR
jgi:hypothetical protein